MAVDKALRSRDFKREAEERKEMIDKLIDQYDSGTGPAGPKVIDVCCFPGEIKFAMRDQHGVLHYRGRILRCIKKRTASAERHLREVHADVVAEIERQSGLL
jgi:hypothetical protein